MRSIALLLILCLGIPSLALTQQYAFATEKGEKNQMDKRPLSYPPLRETDIIWSRKLYQIINTQEKINQTLRHPRNPFFEVLKKAVLSGAIKAYKPNGTDFGEEMSSAQLESLLIQRDTFEIYDPITLKPAYQIINKDITYEEILQYQIKEIWYFDANTSTVRSRILGIAPVQEIYIDSGKTKQYLPLFWIYYPDSRMELARHRAYLGSNDKSEISWTDFFDMHRFSSHIYRTKHLNVERLKKYYTDRELLVESDKIKQEILNFEQDLWSY